jgi:hypothetical protein
MSADDRMDSPMNAIPRTASRTPTWAANRSSSTGLDSSSLDRVGNPNASETSPAKRATNASADVESSMRMNESVNIRATSCDDEVGRVR